MPYEPRSFREQLGPIGVKLREGRALIRPVSQVTLRLKPVEGQGRFNMTVDEILRWMSNRAGRKLPDIAWQRRSFDLSDIGAQRTAAIALDDPTLLYKALLVLRDQYVPMRRDGGSARKQAYEEALKALQIEESATGDGTKYDVDVYSVQYDGVRRSLDRHLKGGNSREPRFCFRLYFFLDDEAQLAVVGWLPSHLDNRMS